MARRLDPDKQRLAETLSEVYFVALSQTFRRWSIDPDLSKEQIPCEVTAILRQIAGVLG